MQQTIPVDEFVVSLIAKASNFDPAAISLDTDLIDIGLDSLGLTAIVGQIEATYGCELTTEQMIELFEAPLIRDLVALVKRAMAS